MIDNSLLRDLRCPETHQILTEADATLVERLNQEITAARLANRGGKPVTEKLDGGLIRADGKCLYPVRHNIPVMLVDEGIALTPPAAVRS